MGELIACDMDRIESDAFKKFFYFFMRVCCRGKVVTKPLRRNSSGVHIQIRRFTKGIYAVEKGSDATIYIQSFIKTGSGTQKLIKERYKDTDRMEIT
jgi:transcription termination factor Rho